MKGADTRRTHIHSQHSTASRHDREAPEKGIEAGSRAPDRPEGAPRRGPLGCQGSDDSDGLASLETRHVDFMLAADGWKERERRRMREKSFVYAVQRDLAGSAQY